MTWDEFDRLKALLEKAEEESLSKQEIQDALMILMASAIDDFRGKMD